jgi:DAK2 domain fusion protein YloV
MGARGNSGVITSQIFRGMSEGVDGRRRVNGFDLAQALTVGNRTAWQAVTKPVEGTILTVIREAAEAAVGAAERTNDVESVLAATVIAAEAALAKTPLLLPILREAGVVDAGGAGLTRLLEGALRHLADAAPAPAARRKAAQAASVNGPADEGFGYETMLLLEPGLGELLDVNAIRAALEAIGESVLVAGDARAVKIHVHSERPDAVIAYALAHGTASRITVENLDTQARDVREQRARAFTTSLEPAAPDRWSAGTGNLAAVGGGQPAPRSSADGSAAPSAGQPGPRQAVGVIAVAAGDGLAAVFRSVGSARIVGGGQSANPSTGELLAAVESMNADRIVLLPNNPNVILAARQVAELTSRDVAVIPTRNAAEGLAAILALDPSADPDANTATMTKAARSIQTLQVTRAVRDAPIGDRPVRKGEVIVLDPDDGLVAVDADEVRAILAALDGLRPGFELLTLYYGEGIDLASAEAVGRRVAAHMPDVEVELVRGGQPHYRYLVAAD